MGHLLSSAIKMQSSAAATATIEINNLGSLDTCAWVKNGVSQGSVTTSVTATLTAGDTFLVSASNSSIGATIDYYLNGTYVTSYFDAFAAETPTITSSADNAYKFDCYGGA